MSTSLQLTGKQLMEFLETLTTEQLNEPVLNHLSSHISPHISNRSLESNWHYEGDHLVMDDIPSLNIPSYFTPQAH